MSRRELLAKIAGTKRHPLGDRLTALLTIEEKIDRVEAKIDRLLVSRG